MSSPAAHEDLIYLPGSIPSYRCSTCSIELALQDELVSRSFSGSRGPAFLLRSVVNVKVGEKAIKQLLTGKHTIAPIHCKGCSTELGWTYFLAPSSDQRYKEGKFILERGRIFKDNKWT